MKTVIVDKIIKVDSSFAFDKEIYYIKLGLLNEVFQFLPIDVLTPSNLDKCVSLMDDFFISPCVDNCRYTNLEFIIINKNDGDDYFIKYNAIVEELIKKIFDFLKDDLKSFVYDTAVYTKWFCHVLDKKIPFQKVTILQKLEEHYKKDKKYG